MKTLDLLVALAEQSLLASQLIIEFGREFFTGLDLGLESVPPGAQMFDIELQLLNGLGSAPQIRL